MMTMKTFRKELPMYQAIPYFFDENAIYIDVRSESEFKTGHIPDAINLPILYDLERHEVGWIYKNASVEEAKRIGLKYGSEKLHLFYDTLFQLRNEYPCKKIIFYCARGGYRSRSIALLLRSIDIPVYWLKGGYKGYRAEVLNKLNQPAENYPDFIVLNGLTGVGKTHILEKLHALDQPVIDLEGAANHRGSNLGTIGTDEFQSVQSFENNLYHQLMQVKTPYCFVESESRRIGQVFVPKTMYNKMQEGHFLLINASMDFRINALIKDYVHEDNFSTVLQKALPRIQPYLSNAIYSDLMRLIESKEYEAFTRLILDEHYDPVYQKSIEKHLHLETFQVEDYAQCSIDIINWLANSSLFQ